MTSVELKAPLGQSISSFQQFGIDMETVEVDVKADHTHTSSFRKLNRSISPPLSSASRLAGISSKATMTEIPLRILKVFPDRLEETYRTIPETHRTWRPQSWEGIPSEPLSALEQLCHLRDIETDGYHVRFSRIVNEDKPTLTSIDGLSLAIERKYADSDPDMVLLEFRRARASTLDMLSNLSELQLKRSGVFGAYGRVTIRSLAHHLASHDFQHLSGMQWLLGKMSSS